MAKSFKPAGLALALVFSLSFIPGAGANAPQTVYSGHVSARQIEKLTTEVNWFKDLKKAEAAAQEQGKLILWVHMVGKIDGAT